MIPTIRDVQIAIKQFNDSIGLNSLSNENGQSHLLKSYIVNIKEYHDYILNLSKDTRIDSIEEPLKSKILAIYNELNTYSSYIDTRLTKTYTSININDYKFRILNVNNNEYTFDLSTVPKHIQDKIAISQRVSIYSKDNVYLQTGLITNIETDYIFIVKVNNLITLDSLDNVAYGSLDLRWNVREYVSIWTNDICFEPSQLNCWLHVKLYDLKSLYNFSWSLYYREDYTKEYKNVAQGTDNVQPGFAYISKAKSIFKSGNYLLKSKIIKYGSYETDIKRIEWDIKDSRSYLKNE